MKYKLTQLLLIIMFCFNLFSVNAYAYNYQYKNGGFNVNLININFSNSGFELKNSLDINENYKNNISASEYLTEFSFGSAIYLSGIAIIYFVISNPNPNYYILPIGLILYLFGAPLGTYLGGRIIGKNGNFEKAVLTNTISLLISSLTILPAFIIYYVLYSVPQAFSIAITETKNPFQDYEPITKIFCWILGSIGLILPPLLTVESYNSDE